jgi:membrane protein
MSLVSRANDVLRARNKPAWAAGMALAATYLLARTLERANAPAEEAAAAGQLAPPAPVSARGWAFWQQVLVNTYRQINEDRLLALAAGVVFYGLLALFPAITALVSCYALFADPATIGNHLVMLRSVMPQGGYAIVQDQIARIVAGPTGHLSFAFLGSLALALWSANAGTKAIIDALNIVFDAKERRGFLTLNVVSLAMTLAALVAMLAAIAAVVVLPLAVSFIPFGALANSVIDWLRWPALFVLAMLGLALLYRFGPNRTPPVWQLVGPGNVVAAFAWLAGSGLLSWYLKSFADYDATYGSLGAAIGLMMWLWMSAIVVLVGAELNAEIAAARAPQAKPPVRIGG